MADQIILEFKVEKALYSCGYSTISNVLNHYQMPVTETDIYFLSNGMKFEMLPKLLVGYSSFESTYTALKERFFGDSIQLYKNLGKEEMKEVIIDQLGKENPILLYTDSKGLTYHNLHQVSYPYHIIIF